MSLRAPLQAADTKAYPTSPAETVPRRDNYHPLSRSSSLGCPFPTPTPVHVMRDAVQVRGRIWCLKWNGGVFVSLTQVSPAASKRYSGYSSRVFRQIKRGKIPYRLIV